MAERTRRVLRRRADTSARTGGDNDTAQTAGTGWDVAIESATRADTPESRRDAAHPPAAQEKPIREPVPGKPGASADRIIGSIATYLARFEKDRAQGLTVPQPVARETIAERVGPGDSEWVAALGAAAAALHLHGPDSAEYQRRKTTAAEKQPQPGNPPDGGDREQDATRDRGVGGRRENLIHDSALGMAMHHLANNPPPAAPGTGPEGLDAGRGPSVLDALADGLAKTVRPEQGADIAPPLSPISLNHLSHELLAALGKVKQAQPRPAAQVIKAWQAKQHTQAAPAGAAAPKPQPAAERNISASI